MELRFLSATLTFFQMCFSKFLVRFSGILRDSQGFSGILRDSQGFSEIFASLSTAEKSWYCIISKLWYCDSRIKNKLIQLQWINWIWKNFKFSEAAFWDHCCCCGVELISGIQGPINSGISAHLTKNERKLVTLQIFWMTVHPFYLKTP